MLIHLLVSYRIVFYLGFRIYPVHKTNTSTTLNLEILHLLTHLTMAAEEDNFDIDIYGDGGEDYQPEEQPEPKLKPEPVVDTTPNITDTIDQVPGTVDGTAESVPNGQASHSGKTHDNHNEQPNDVAQKISSTDDSTHDSLHLPKQAPQTQGLKRKDGFDDRHVDPGATTALFISELNWWVTDDDVRGWANQSQCEDELEDMTFSEHKVNGKSKGYLLSIR